MKTLVSALVCLLLLQTIAFAQRPPVKMVGPWKITTEDTNTTYSILDHCQIVVNEGAITLGIQVIIHQHFDEFSKIRERVIVDFSQGKPKIIYQVSWYESRDIWGIKRIERGHYWFDESRKAWTGKPKKYLFAKFKYLFEDDFMLLPNDIRRLVQLLY